jgi:hypothetical protein
MVRFTGILIAMALATSSAASAQSPDQDVRCMVLSEAFKVNPKVTPPQRQAAAATSLYFLGRVSARSPVADIRARYLAQARRLQGQPLGTLMNGCVQLVQSQERALIAAKQAMIRSLTKPGTPQRR